MTTLAQIADRAQNALNDAAAGTWPQATIEEWIVEALRDYSTMFPLIGRYTINCTAGNHAYQLTQVVTTILSVEYPKGQDPPQYLQRRDRRHPDFWTSDRYYDYVILNDATFGSSGSGFTSSTLWIGAETAVGQQIEVTYHGIHDITLTPIQSITVPYEHEHLLILFVVWKAHTERLGTEIQTPDTTIRMIQQMKLAVEAAERSYKSAARELQQRAGAGGLTGPWKVDGHDRIY